MCATALYNRPVTGYIRARCLCASVHCTRCSVYCADAKAANRLLILCLHNFGAVQEKEKNNFAATQSQYFCFAYPGGCRDFGHAR